MKNIMKQENTKRAENLKRLLAPRHIAFIGGADADYSARQCAQRFHGKIWGVNPNREKMGGEPCYASVQDLPEAPDAVFLAIPRSATIPVIRALNDMGAGGVVCFTAGYGETGDEGKKAERELVDAAGDMALVGPNCYGLINYIHDVALWPFGAGSCRCDKGIALIMQSGMIPADMVMNQRSVPLACVVSAGNQAMLAVEDYVEVLSDDPGITAFGIYLEGIRDIKSFARAALKALRAEKPIVLLKAGSSSIGSRLAVSHTGSLSGADEAHQALFDQLGIIRVHSPEVMLETLKFMTISGIPRGNRIAAFTCSGGEALMVADYCERVGLVLPQPSDSVQRELKSLLPDIATISNPLDYTTPLWGNREVMPKVFAAALKTPVDAAIFIQDYPPEGFEADSAFYRADGISYMESARAAKIPAAICSELAENFDRESREMYAQGHIAPLQGIDRGLDALGHAARYARNRNRLMRNPGMPRFSMIETPGNEEETSSCVLNEWESKQWLGASGVTIPTGRLVSLDNCRAIGNAADEIGFPVAIKLVAEGLAHKTELGVVAVNLTGRQEIAGAMAAIRESIASHTLNDIRGVLIESMVQDPVYELLVGIQRNPQFGLVMVIAAGGILAELYRDSQTLLLPTSIDSIRHGLSQLQCFPVLTGFRGRQRCDLNKLAATILELAEFAETHAGILVEMEINPLMVLADDAVAADALVRLVANPDQGKVPTFPERTPAPNHGS